MKEAAAVGARGRSLQPVVPRRELRSSCPDLLLTTLPVARVIRAVVLLSAGLAPGLEPIPTVPAVELGKSLLDSTAAAFLHCQSRLQSVADGANMRPFAVFRMI